MNYDENEINRILESFGIDVKRVTRRESYTAADINYISPTSTYIATRYSEPIVEAQLDEKFVHMLIDYYKCQQHYSYNVRYDYNYINLSDPRLFIDYVNYRIKKEENEKKLQDKYPELREIMRDYEVTKALIVNENKKS